MRIKRVSRTEHTLRILISRDWLWMYLGIFLGIGIASIAFWFANTYTIQNPITQPLIKERYVSPLPKSKESSLIEDFSTTPTPVIHLKYTK